MHMYGVMGISLAENKEALTKIVLCHRNLILIFLNIKIQILIMRLVIMVFLLRKPKEYGIYHSQMP